MNKNMNKLSGKNIVRYAAIGSYLLSASYLLGSAEEGESIRPPENQPVLTTAEKNEQLLVAAEIGDLNAVQALIKADANVNVRNKWGESPLYLAAQHGHLGVVEKLLAAPGIDVNAKDDHRENTPLYWAMQNDYLDVVKALLAVPGINVNAENDVKDRPLYVAVYKGRLGVVEALIGKGADVNARNRWNETPLHVAAGKGHLKIVQVLLAVEGIEVNILNNKDKTALDMALEGLECAGRDGDQEDQVKYQAVIDLLRKYGGKTGAEIAAEAGN